VLARAVGSGSCEALTVPSARFDPKMETIDPGAIGMLAEKLAPLTTGFCGNAGGLLLLTIPSGILRIRLFTRSAT
jgi:hypothetical protein